MTLYSVDNVECLAFFKEEKKVFEFKFSHDINMMSSGNAFAVTITQCLSLINSAVDTRHLSFILADVNASDRLIFHDKFHVVNEAARG